MNSELRQDIVSGDWIVIAPGRAKRPDQLLKKEKRIKALKKDCVFEDPQKTNSHPVFIFPDDKKKWRVQVIPNKYPVFASKNICPQAYNHGPYSIIEGIGRHEVVISKDHDKNFPYLSKEDANLVFRAFKERYLNIANDICSVYVAIFQNWGRKAGASIYHPHYQIMSIPVVPPDVSHSISGSDNFYKRNKKCVHCEMIEWEKEYGKRIVYENEGAIVFAPFISREPFELRVFPKKHLSYFEDTAENDMEFAVEALQAALKKIKIKLKDPDYNFFIHTAPVKDKKAHSHYHWHIEILPKISISAGFELGTGIEITMVDPDEAAKILR
ncbi:MAG: Galactose-1-phosphate uridylyltransferase [Candidatus Wolfebacteria bacterium GW2011_GWC1_37_10]|uniref:Galactose-1-phosphate uridylyltransferase n=1 Tax=Candidatus Wolfebacteria bacterium GW2011_GWC1_37_10 TaxID=1619010 RepID=A0A0G0G7X3_9BACT|nr:MAG: Galactose-1-phosphate uridylyltransferase [Candidatus Wolfebacteria bacterium GW2011_GWC1_37_10]